MPLMNCVNLDQETPGMDNSKDYSRFVVFSKSALMKVKGAYAYY